MFLARKRLQAFRDHFTQILGVQTYAADHMRVHAILEYQPHDIQARFAFHHTARMNGVAVSIQGHIFDPTIIGLEASRPDNGLDIKCLTVVKQRQAEATVQVVTKYVDRVKVVREAGDTIIKEVPVYVPAEADSACVLYRGFVRLHDAAAAGRIPPAAGVADALPAGIALSAVAGTVANNYQRCRENAEQLKSLQEWVKAQEAATNEQ